jgi:hypothetical protein
VDLPADVERGPILLSPGRPPQHAIHQVLDGMPIRRLEINVIALLTRHLHAKSKLEHLVGELRNAIRTSLDFVFHKEVVHPVADPAGG